MVRIRIVAAVLVGLVLVSCKNSTTPTPLAASAPTAAPGSAAAAAPQLTLQRYEGPSVVTELGYGIKINNGSSLKREWYVLVDPAAPSKIDGAAGIEVRYTGSNSGRSDFEYRSKYAVATAEPITAIEVHVQLFDVFGRVAEGLKSTEVKDISGSAVMNDSWRASTNDAAVAFTSVMYVSRVRTSAGKVYSIDQKAVLEQLRSVGSKITEADLEPKK